MIKPDNSVTRISGFEQSNPDENPTILYLDQDHYKRKTKNAFYLKWYIMIKFFTPVFAEKGKSDIGRFHKLRWHESYFVSQDHFLASVDILFLFVLDKFSS